MFLRWQQNAPANMVLVNSHEELQFCIEQAQHQQKLLVVNYFGEQCYACKSLYPKLCQIARDNYDVLFAKVNLTQSDHVRLLLEEQGITTVPFFQLYQFGVVVSKFSASLNPQKLAVLRAEIAANKGSGLAGTDSPVYTTLEA
jgi:thioredoxin-like negative regulator of GroEL